MHSLPCADLVDTRHTSLIRQQEQRCPVRSACNAWNIVESFALQDTYGSWLSQHFPASCYTGLPRKQHTATPEQASRAHLLPRAHHTFLCHMVYKIAVPSARVCSARRRTWRTGLRLDALQTAPLRKYRRNSRLISWHICLRDSGGKRPSQRWRQNVLRRTARTHSCC